VLGKEDQKGSSPLEASECGESSTRGGARRHAAQIATTPARPVTFYLEAGRFESGPLPDGGPGVLVANRHLRNVLRAKGYPLTYHEYSGGHDHLCWRGGLCDGLIALGRA